MPKNFVPHAYPSRPIPPEISSPLELKSPDLRDLFAAWLKAKGEQEMPANPRDILQDVRPLMPYLLLFDPIDDGRDFLLRLMGNGVFPDLDDKPQGKRISEHSDPGIGLRFLRLLQETYCRRGAVRGLAPRFTPVERRNYLVETLWLPFGSQAGVTRVLTMGSFDPLPK